jgi:PIN domain nuclease of toxin-antitoxin system
VRLLLDTHAFLFWAANVRRLPRRAKTMIGRAQTEVFLSAATAWEIRIKVAKGRLQTDFDDVVKEADKHRFDFVSITAEHAQFAGDLPLHHDDPFDRILIAQARLEGLTLVTSDKTFERYGVPILWD